MIKPLLNQKTFRDGLTHIGKRVVGGFTKLTGMDLPEKDTEAVADAGDPYYGFTNEGLYFPGEDTTTPQPDVRIRDFFVCFKTSQIYSCYKLMV